MAIFNQLFQLVHSLSQSEKRYFKIFSSFQAGNKVYIRLFDAIAKQKMYDEKKLKEKLNIVAFSTAKIYLYNLIMRSLRSQQQNQNMNMQLHDLLKDVEILFQKGLFEQSHKLLVKAKKIARTFEKFPLLLEIYQLEHLLSNTTMNTVQHKRIFESGHKEAVDTIAALKEQMEQRKIINLLIYKDGVRGKVIRDKSDKKNVYKEASAFLNKKPATLLSYKAKIFHHNINELYYYSINDIKGAYRNSKNSIRSFESNPILLTQDIHNYMSAINNLMNAQMTLHKYEEIKSCIDKLKTIPVTTVVEKVKIFGFCAGREIVYFSHTGRYKEGLESIPLIEKQLELYENKISKSAYFVTCANIEELFIICGKFKQALHWNNKILNDPQVESFYVFHSNARMSEIIIHYELDNIEKVHSLLKSYHLILTKNKGKYNFENSFIRFFRTLINISEQKELKDIFLNFHKELQRFANDPFESEAFNFFDLIFWLESKIENRPFATIMKEKIGKY